MLAPRRRRPGSQEGRLESRSSPLLPHSSIPLDATTYTPLSLNHVFQDEITALDAAYAQKAVWHQRVVDARAKVARARQVRLA